MAAVAQTASTVEVTDGDISCDLTVAAEMLNQLQNHVASIQGKVEQENAYLLEIQRLELANRELELTVEELNRQIDDLHENNEIQKALAAKALEGQDTTARKLRHARRVIRDLLDEGIVPGGSPNEDDLGLERQPRNFELEDLDSSDFKEDDLTLSSKDEPFHGDKGTTQIQPDPEKKPELAKEGSTSSDVWSVVSNPTESLYSRHENSPGREASSYAHMSDNVGAPERHEGGGGNESREQTTRIPESKNSDLDSKVTDQEFLVPADSEAQTENAPLAATVFETQNVPTRGGARTPLHLAATEPASITFRSPRSARIADDATSATFTPRTIPGSVNDGKWKLNFTKPPASVSAAGPLSWSALRHALDLSQNTILSLQTLGFEKTRYGLQIQIEQNLAFVFDPIFLESPDVVYLVDWGTKSGNQNTRKHIRENVTGRPFLHTLIFKVEKDGWFYIGAHEWKFEREMWGIWPQLGDASRRRLLDKFHSRNGLGEAEIFHMLEENDLKQICVSISGASLEAVSAEFISKLRPNRAQ